MKYQIVAKYEELDALKVTKNFSRKMKIITQFCKSYNIAIFMKHLRTCIQKLIVNWSSSMLIN